MKNYYEVLQVDKNASPEIIEKVYKTLVKKYHPDLQPAEERQVAEQKMKLINEAYEILSDNLKRAEYDQKLEMQKLKEEQLKQAQENKVNYSDANPNTNTQNIYNSPQNTNTAPNNYNPIKEPLQYYSKTVKDYINQNKQNNYNQSNNEKIYNEKIRKAYSKAYNDAYINTLKNLGYKIKYKKNFKDYIRTFITLLVVILVFVILWHIPFVQNMLLNIYNQNQIIKIVVDILMNIVSSFLSTITNISLLF